jgi:chromosome segregation ATPase
MKTIGAFALIALALLGVRYVASPLSVSAASMEGATKNLNHAQSDMRQAATTARAQATAISTTLDHPDQTPALPNELQDFTRTTDRLTTQRERLRQAIDDYKTAYNAKLLEFDKERAQISNPSTQRSMNVLRRHTESDMNDRLQNATATLDQLDTVLSQGADLQHAAQCVIIANDLHNHGEDLDNQLRDAKTQATTYAATTTSLLARINQALTD